MVLFLYTQEGVSWYLIPFVHKTEVCQLHCTTDNAFDSSMRHFWTRVRNLPHRSWHWTYQEQGSEQFNGLTVHRQTCVYFEFLAACHADSSSGMSPALSLLLWCAGECNWLQVQESLPAAAGFNSSFIQVREI